MANDVAGKSSEVIPVRSLLARAAPGRRTAPGAGATPGPGPRLAADPRWTQWPLGPDSPTTARGPDLAAARPPEIPGACLPSAPGDLSWGCAMLGHPGAGEGGGAERDRAAPNGAA